MNTYRIVKVHSQNGIRLGTDEEVPANSPALVETFIGTSEDLTDRLLHLSKELNLRIFDNDVDNFLGYADTNKEVYRER